MCDYSLVHSAILGYHAWCLKMLTQCYAKINALQRGRVPVKAREERPGSQAVVFRGACHHPLIVGSKSYRISENLRKPSV